MMHDLVLITLNWLFKNLGRYSRVGSSLGCPAILCVIFELDRVFLVSGQIFQLEPNPSLDRVGFFSGGLVGFIGSGGP